MNKLYFIYYIFYVILVLFVIINFYLIQVYFPNFFSEIILSMVVVTSSFKFQKEELSNIIP